jgi:hypothetical protein
MAASHLRFVKSRMPTNQSGFRQGHLRSRTSGGAVSDYCLSLSRSLSSSLSLPFPALPLSLVR